MSSRQRRAAKNWMHDLKRRSANGDALARTRLAGIKADQSIAAARKAQVARAAAKSIVPELSRIPLVPAFDSQEDAVLYDLSPTTYRVEQLDQRGNPRTVTVRPK